MSHAIPRPNLPQALLLLALDDAEGHVLAGAQMGLNFGLAGAALMELALAERLQMDDDEVRVIDAGTTGVPALDAILARLSEAPGKPLGHWVRVLPSACDLRQTLLDELVREGVLERREQRILWIFRITKYPEKDGSSEHDLRACLDDILLHNKPADPRMRLLIDAAQGCHVLDALYPHDQRGTIKNRIQALQSTSDACGDAIEDALKAQQAAAVAAICAASVAATAAATSAAAASCAAGGAACT